MSGYNPNYSRTSMSRTLGINSIAAGLQSRRTFPQSPTSPSASTSEASRPSKRRRLDGPISSTPLAMNPSKRAEKIRQLSAEADTKREIRTLACHAKADQGHELLKGITAKGDRLKIWFRNLGLPCHPERVARVKSSNPPMGTDEQPTTRQLRPSHIPPPPEDTDSESGTDSDSGRMDRDDEEYSEHPVDVKYATASSITPEQMETFLQWQFLKAQRDPKFRIKNSGDIYTDRYRYCEVETRAVHDITRPVEHKLNKDGTRYLALDRQITRHLRAEQYRMFSQEDQTINPRLPDQEHLEKQPRLYIPTTWTEELKKEEPKYVAMPASHAGWIPKPIYKGFRREEGSVATDTQSSGSTHSNFTPSGGVMAPPIKGPQLPPPEIVQYVHSTILGTPQHQETPEGNRLLLKYRFDENDSSEVKEAKAFGLNKELRVLNLPWERRRAIQTMFTRTAAIPGVAEVVKLLDPLHIKHNDDYFGNGNTTLNCNSQDLLLFEPFIIEKFLAFPGCVGEMSSEGTVEKIVGNLLKGIVAGSDFLDRDNSPLPFPKHLKVVGSNPSPDIYVRAVLGEKWLSTLLPVLFAGECKPKIHYDIWMPRAQLACAFHATLVTFVLYYLDTRHSTDSALPPWLFLYGIEYTEFGVIIHAHHPAYRIIDNRTGAGQWTFKATSIVTEYEEAFKQGRSYILQIQLLAALFRVRSHSIHVLERLKQWERGPEILKILVSESKKKDRHTAAWVKAKNAGLRKSRAKFAKIGAKEE